VPDDVVTALRGAPAAHRVSVLDAYEVIAHLRGETCAAEVAALLGGPTVLTAVNAGEIVDQLVRVFGRDPDDVRADLALCWRAPA
jgi:PIN domain nuclease of toxin-antitoxin system